MKKFFLTILSMLLLYNIAVSVPILNSYSSATATIYLDFDGDAVVGTAWNNGNALNCQASTLTDAQIIEVFNRVSEDFRPFNINITTDSTVYLSKPLNMRNRIIITPTSAWAPGVGGCSYPGSFALNNDIPAFVFSDRLGPNSGKMIGECCSHEIGHTLGLDHQSKYDGLDCLNPIEFYSNGAGTGQAAWSPIMGNSYYRNMTTWNNGPMPTGCTDLQDNLTIITTQNGFGYRVDDYIEAMNGSTTTVTPNFSKSGIITTATDRDAFKFTLATNSTIHVTAIPYNLASDYVGANLDIKVELYNAAGTLIRSYDPPATMSVTIDTVLNNGTYYWKIDGAGNVNIGDYGSLGAYTFSGTSSALPIHSVVLSGNTNKGTHLLNWAIKSDESIKNIVVESSANGISFAALSSFAPTSNKFSYNPYQNNTIYYRLRVTSVINQTVYSNTISLKNTESADDLFKVSTLVQNDVRVNAAENYQYKLIDINGRKIAVGNGIKGINTINVSNQASGMYILQLFANTKTQTERIVKN
jgi:hypothetical protein